MKPVLSIATAMLLFLPAYAPAQTDAAPTKRAAHESWMVDNDWGGFLDGHPDMLYFKLGTQAYRKEEFPKAMRLYRHAARYADKPSQAMIAEMYWNGLGVDRDRALAYVWMDLAAERAYPEFLRLRESFWAAMSEQERERALRQGKSVYAQFGDDVAQDRIVKYMRRARKSVAGSRTGFVGNTQILAMPPSTQPGLPGEDSEYAMIDGQQFFASTYWDPKHYFKWREAHWRERLPRTGHVEIGELETTQAQPREEP